MKLKFLIPLLAIILIQFIIILSRDNKLGADIIETKTIVENPITPICPACPKCLIPLIKRTNTITTTKSTTTPNMTLQRLRLLINKE